MDTSTPAQQEPAQPPPTDGPPPMDSRNDSVAHDESAPLLEANESSLPTRNTSTKVFYVLTSIALSSSALTLIFIIAAFIALEVDRNSYGLSWAVSESMRSITAPVVFSLLFSSYNFAESRNRRGVAPFNVNMAPLVINILCDILVAVVAVSYAAVGLSDITSGGSIPAKILAGIALALAAICGIAHIGLFALRCRLAYRSEFWKRPWSFPNGQLTLEFSIKFYKEPLRPRERGDDAA